MGTQLVCLIGRFDQGLQLTRLVHFGHDVATTNEFAVDVKLRDGWPVGIVFNAITDCRVVQYVDGDHFLGVARFQNLNGAAGEPAHGELCRAFHEQHDWIGGDGLVDGVANAHDISFLGAELLQYA